MKKILLILAISFVAGAANAQQAIHDASHVLKGYIGKNGLVQDVAFNTLCQFHQDGKIVDVHGSIIGYIVNEYELQDAGHVVKGYIQRDGTVENPSHVTIAHINISGMGAIMDNLGNTIAYTEEIEPMWSAAYLFLLGY